ncbi:MAG TPA: hypothetical protein VNT92_12790 [Acidimicrobiia bacterium]|nr:hypothetical protein [Acidimicrobiia bacterium]
MSGMRAGAVTAAGWLLVLGVVVVGLTTVGDPATSVVLYTGVWLASTTVPGVLVWRALARPTSFVQELGFGSALGIALLLLAWLPATLAGLPLLMWLWPAGVVVAFAAIPSLRRHWWPRRSPGHQTPARWHAAMMVVSTTAFARMYVTALEFWPLPPKSSSSIFQDAWFHLALTQALGHGVVVDDPSVAGVVMHYHWFSNAHIAATQALSGLPAQEVHLHLWLVPMLMTLLFAVAAATERILQGPSGPSAPPVRWWAGPLAALLAGSVPAVWFLGTPRLPDIDNGFVHSSPSGILALLVVLALVGPVLDVLHGHADRWTWLLLLALLVLGAGTKPSLLPVIACGGLLVLLTQWVRTRTFPRQPAILTLLPLLLIPLAAVALFGSTDGSRIQLFQTLALDPAFDGAVVGDGSLPGRGGWLAPDLVGASGEVWEVALGLLALFILTELPRLIGIAGPLTSSLRGDPATWWCAGVVGAGFCGLWFLSHPGYSQHYFWRIVIPLGIVLTVTTIVRLLPDGRSGALQLVVVTIAGIVTAAVFVEPHPQSLGQEEIRELSYLVPDRLVPYAVTIAVLTVTILMVRALQLLRGWTRVPVLALAAGFTCAVGATAAAYDLHNSVQFARAEPVVMPTGPRYISADEQRAALWLNSHSAEDDLVATNVFCLPVRYRDDCHHGSFWVPALTGRQMFIGGWAYTEKNLEAYGRGGYVPYQRLPSPWPDRVSVSLKAVRSPTPAVIAQLERRGVDWIFADRRATRISPRLGELADLEFRNDEVQIYRLDR